jgi:hypothetical protein
VRSQQEPAFGFQDRRAKARREARLPPSPATSQRQRQTRLPLLGIALPAVAGSLFWLVPMLWSPSGFFAFIPFAIIAAAIIALTFMGGVLLHSWWALLAVPAAWVLGETLTSVAVSTALYGVGWLTDTFNGALFWPLTGLVIALEAAPVLACASLGVLYSKWLRRQGLWR